MNSREIAQEWFVMANLDIDSAEFLRNMKPVPVEIICYHCQQGAEKYLKGYIALHGREVPKIHDLVVLNKYCIEIDSEFDSIESYCIDLTDYGVQMRYPFHFEVIESDAVKALKDVERIKIFILSRI